MAAALPDDYTVSGGVYMSLQLQVDLDVSREDVTIPGQSGHPRVTRAASLAAAAQGGNLSIAYKIMKPCLDGEGVTQRDGESVTQLANLLIVGKFVGESAREEDGKGRGEGGREGWLRAGVEGPTFHKPRGVYPTHEAYCCLPLVVRPLAGY